MDYSVVLDLLIDYSYIEAVIILFRVNNDFYKRLNLNKLKTVLGLNKGDTLKEIYSYYLINKEFNNDNYDNCVKLHAKYNTDYLSDEVIDKINFIRYFTLVVENDGTNLYTNLLHKILNIYYMGLPYLSSIPAIIINKGNVDMLIEMKKVLIPGCLLDDLLENNYYLINNVEMYNLFRQLEITFTDLDIQNLSSTTNNVLRFIYNDKDESLDEVKIKIWRVTNSLLSKRILLENACSRDCIRILYDSSSRSCNNRCLEDYIHWIGKEKVRKGVEKYKIRNEGKYKIRYLKRIEKLL